MSRYPPPTFDHGRAIERYKVLLSYTEVAKEFNISRERIRQIVKKYCPEIRPLAAHLNLDVCTFCGKSESKDKVEVSGKYCTQCHSLIKQVNRRGGLSEQYLNRKRTHCVLCGIAFGPPKTLFSRCGRGRCKRCASRERAKTAHFKAVQKRSREKHRAEHLVRMKRYYQEHKEELREYQKRWQQLHPESKKKYHGEYQRKRYLQKKLKKREEKRQERINRYQSVAIE